jgi:hypothetical protein
MILKFIFKCDKLNFFLLQATAPVLKWEKKFIEMMEEVSRNAQGIKVFYEAGRRYDSF